MGKSLLCGPLHPLGYHIMLLGVLGHLFLGPNSLKIPQKGQNAHFSAFGALSLRPLVAKSKSAFAVPCGLA